MAGVESSPNRGGMLDQAPPQPPGGAPRATLMDNQRQSPGIGAEAGNPQIVALQGLAMIDQGTQMISAAVPQLAPALTGLIAQLKQAIPQAMADQISGAGPAGAGPGGAPGAMPPSAPPMPAGAPAA